MRRRRSRSWAITLEVRDGSVEADLSAAATGDSGEELGWGRSLGEAGELSSQILLERLALPFGSSLQGAVDVVGKIAHQDARHASILIARCGRVKGAEDLARAAVL
jgi:hypothetical protein